MKSKIISFILCIIYIFSINPFSIGANAYSSDIEAIIKGIKAYKESTYEQDLEKAFAQDAGVANVEWYIIALRKYEDSEFSEYALKAEDFLSSSESLGSVEKQRYALTLSLLNVDSDIISKTLESTVGELGIMSYIVGLMLSDSVNSEKSADITRQILDAELESGGWALNTNGPADTDVTAMALTALSSHKNDEEVSLAIERNLGILSKRQTENGDCNGFGGANCESTAQMIITLCSLGIDPLTDERFIKNSNTLIDGLKLYRCESGGFSHVTDADENDYATSQALLAFVSFWMFQNDKGTIYGQLRDIPQVTTATQSITTATTTMASNVTEVTDNETVASKQFSKGKIIKIFIMIFVLLIFLSFTVFLKLKSRLGIKRFLALFVTFAIIEILVFSVNIKTSDEYYSKSESVDDNYKTVYISITAKAADNYGEILERTEIAFDTGDTVYDVFLEATRENQIQTDIEGIGESAYIRGIDYLYEYDMGELSGWMYRVNGENADIGVGSYVVSENDEIEFFYTLTLGQNSEEEV